MLLLRPPAATTATHFFRATSSILQPRTPVAAVAAAAAAGAPSPLANARGSAPRATPTATAAAPFAPPFIPPPLYPSIPRLLPPSSSLPTRPSSTWPSPTRSHHACSTKGSYTTTPGPATLTHLATTRAAMDPNQSQPTLSAPPAGAAPVPSLATTQQPGDAAASGPAPQPGSGVCRIAVAQMTAVGDQQANYDTCARLAKDAVDAGCRMLFLPECFSFIGESQAESLTAAQPLDGPLMGQYKELARSLGLWMSLGGFQEVGPDPSHIYNTHVVLNDKGELVARYRKIHLFDVDVPNGPVLMESRTTAPGSELVVVDTPAGRLGLTTCYDLRFPEMYAKLTWEMGAQILAVPSAFTVVTGEAHWEVLLRARAIECQAYVVAAAQAGRHNAKRESWGHALAADPWGGVVGALADPRVTGIATVDVDLGLVARVRERMPCGAHRAKGRAAWVGGSG